MLYSGLMLFSWLPLKVIQVDSHVPGFGGMTFNMLLYMYVTGRFLRESGFVSSIRLSRAAIIFIVLMIVNMSIAILSGLTKGSATLNMLFSTWRVNDSPLVIAMAVFFFIIFYKLHVATRIANVAIVLAPSMFCVYLIHCGVNFNLTRGWIEKYLFLIPANNMGKQIVATLIATLATFLICILADLLRRYISKLARGNSKCFSV